MAEAATAPVDGQPVKKPKTPKEWLDEIARSEGYQSKYLKRAKKISEIYAEQARDTEDIGNRSRQFALLWANQEVLRPAVYARQPQPVVRRRFADRDPVGRAVSDVAERCVTSIFDRSDVDNTLRSVRDDFLLVGRGTTWVRYEPTMAQETLEEGKEPEEVLKGETLVYDYVHWSDLVHPKARRWKDLPWLGRRVFLTDDAGEKRFGAELWAKVKVKQAADQKGQDAQTTPGTAPKDQVCTYEIWSRADRKVLWLAKGFDEAFLDEQPPLYNLQEFYPCPRPAYATLLTDSLIPIPDYVYYQDQAEEINDLTKRIGALSDALKLVGFYPAGAEGEVAGMIETALSPESGNRMIPVPSWAAFAEGGGAKGLVQWLPIEAVINTINACVLLRRQLIDDVFQITGLSDILRGETQAAETATAQSIKAQWGGIRIRDRQQELQRFARDLVRISGEIVAELFQPETLWEMSGLKFPTQAEKAQVAQLVQQHAQMAAQPPGMPPGPPQPGQPPQAPQQPAPPPIPPQAKKVLESPTQEEIVDLLRNDRLRSYRVDIETDSTVEADEQAEKASRNEFLTAVGGFIQQALPVAQQVPEFVPALGEMLMFTVRGYRAGRQLEDVIEQSVQALTEKASAPQPPQPDPKMVEAQAAIERDNARTQADIADQQTRTQADLAEKQARLQMDAQDKAARLDMDRQSQAATFEMDRNERAIRLATEQQSAQQNAERETAVAQSKQAADADSVGSIRAVEARMDEMAAAIAQIGAAIQSLGGAQPQPAPAQ